MTLFYPAIALLTFAVPVLASTEGSGQLNEFVIESKAYGHARKVAVYTPPGYVKDRAEPYGMLICFDGLTYYTHEIPVPAILEGSKGRGLPPMIAILVDTSEGRLEDLANNQKFAVFLGDEVIPWARSRWHITKDPRHVVVAGASAGGLGAAYVAFRRPDLFGNVLSQSGAFWRGNESSNSAPFEWLTSQYAAAGKKAIRFYVEVGSKEERRALGTGPVFIGANRRIRDVLLKKGYPVTYVEVPGGEHEPGHWARQFPVGLEQLVSNWDH